VSFSVPSGSLNAVVGANGAGKTSLVRAIAGMLRPSGGQVLFNGIDITGLESSETCELGIGQVAEGRQIFRRLPSMKTFSSAARCGARRATTQ
jgi:branched-chain amino acid transport system ATP-binding protein